MELPGELWTCIFRMAGLQHLDGLEDRCNCMRVCKCVPFAPPRAIPKPCMKLPYHMQVQCRRHARRALHVLCFGRNSPQHVCAGKGTTCFPMVQAVEGCAGPPGVLARRARARGLRQQRAAMPLPDTLQAPPQSTAGCSLFHSYTASTKTAFFPLPFIALRGE